MLPNFQFHHVGIAVHIIEDIAQYYIDADYILNDIIYDNIQNVSIAFFEKKGEPKIELIAPNFFY